MAITAQQYKQQLRAMIGRGAALNVPDDSNLDKLLTAMAQEFARIDGRCGDLLREMIPDTTDELLTEWETALGLPDECFSTPENKAGRRELLVSRLVAKGGQSRQYFIDLAASIGFNVTITEPATHSWDVDLDMSVEYLRAGSPCNEPLREYLHEHDVECLFEKYKPAHSVLTFTYSGTSGNVWSALTSGTAQHLRSIWYDDVQGLWVAVGDNGTILTSSDDGTNWTARTSGTTNSLRTVKKWNGAWYVVGHGNGTDPATVLKSSDGITWSAIDIGGPDSYLVDIAFNNDVLLFVGWSTNATPASLLVRTYDGVNFTRVVDSFMSYFYGIHWSATDEVFGVVGDDGSLTEYFATSADDGVNWTQHTTQMTTDIWVIDQVNGNWILGTGSGEIRTTENLTTYWVRWGADIDGEAIWRITHNNGGVVLMCGGSTDAHIMRSLDNGASWQMVFESVSGGVMSKAIYGPGYWIAVGWNGAIIKSNN